MVQLVDPAELAMTRDFDNRYAGGARRFGVARNAVREVPTIDLTPFVGHGDERSKRAVAAEMRRACIDIGFFQLVGHGVSRAEIEESLDWGLRFFRLPLAEKMKLHASKSPSRRGFIGAGGVNPEANPDKTPDVKERFMISREAFPGEDTTSGFTRGASQWPLPGMLDGFETFMRPHIRNRIELTRIIIRAFAMSLDLPETHFDAMYARMGGSLALNYYPPIDPEILASAQWSFSPHTDYGGVTLLTQDRTGGLQARNCDGEWIDIPPTPGAFVINIGDMFAMQTNDLYASNLHRVINTTGEERISIAFFTSPSADTIIDCLPSCRTADNPPRYDPIRAGDYNNVMINQSHRTGRPGVSRETANRLTMA